MTYRLKTFRVQFVAEPAEFSTGSPCRSSADVERLGHPSRCGLESMNRGCPKSRSQSLFERRPSLKPAEQHHQPDHDGNQQQQIRRFPNKYFADVHFSVRAGFRGIPFFSGPISRRLCSNVEYLSGHQTYGQGPPLCSLQ